MLMSHQRIFGFPVAGLIGAAGRLLGAVRDTTAGPAVLKRLKAGFDAGFDAQIKLVEKGGGDQSTAGGAMIQPTQEQATAYTEMERLMKGRLNWKCRRTGASGMWTLPKAVSLFLPQ